MNLRCEVSAKTGFFNTNIADEQKIANDLQEVRLTYFDFGGRLHSKVLMYLNQVGSSSTAPLPGSLLLHFELSRPIFELPSQKSLETVLLFQGKVPIQTMGPRPGGNGIECYAARHWLPRKG